MAIVKDAQLRMNSHATRVAEAETSAFKETSKSTKASVKASAEPRESCQRVLLTKTLHAPPPTKLPLELPPPLDPPALAHALDQTHIEIRLEIHWQIITYL
jgi:hypothetical protein